MSGQRTSHFVAAAFPTAAYGALLICVLGFVTLWNDAPVIDVGGVGVVPVMLAAVAAVAAFFLVLLRALRPVRPAYTVVIAVALAATLVHLAALWLLSVAFGADAAASTAAAAASVAGWSSPSFVLLAVVCAWAGVALRRTEAGRPRWPWERDEP